MFTEANSQPGESDVLGSGERHGRLRGGDLYTSSCESLRVRCRAEQLIGPIKTWNQTGLRWNFIWRLRTHTHTRGLARTHKRTHTYTNTHTQSCVLMQKCMHFNLMALIILKLFNPIYFILGWNVICNYKELTLQCIAPTAWSHAISCSCAQTLLIVTNPKP